MSSRKRVREAPQRYEEVPPTKLGRGDFSDTENATLLSALLRFGPNDISKLTQCLPTRNEYQVKQRVNTLQKKAQQSLTSVRKELKSGAVRYEQRDKVAIDRWLDHLTNLHEKAEIVHGAQEELPVRMIARSMGLIAKYENHPDPKECGGVNFKNVYEFLENMMLGLPSKTCNFADAKFLITALQRLSTFVGSDNVGKELSFVLCGRPQWRSKGQSPRTYGVNKEESKRTTEILKFLNTVKYNPFQVTPKWLEKKIEIP